MNVAVLGAGNGGQSIAAHLTLMGHRVRIYDRYPAVIEPLQEVGTIRLSGAIDGLATPESITADLAEAMTGAELIMVTVPGFAFEYLAQAMAPHLVDGQIVVLHPGGTGGALEVRRVWNEVGQGREVLLGCTETLVYATRLRRPGDVDIKAIKNAVSVAGLPASDGERVFQAFRSLYPQAVRAGSVLETSFANTNPTMHPPIVLANARIIDEGIAPFDFYGTGVTTGVASVIDAVDAERMAVAAALGVPTKTQHEWVKFAYGVEGDDTAALCADLSDEIYKGIESPALLRSRYLTEDVPLGLVPWALLARMAEVSTPVMDSIITLASTMCREDFWSTGRTLARMGLDGMSVSQILEVAGGEQRRAMAGSA